MQKRALYIEAALLVTEDSDSSSEQQLEFFDSQREFHKEDNRHLFKDTTDPLVKENHLTTDYLHKDGFCDCNSQGRCVSPYIEYIHTLYRSNGFVIT